MDAIEIVCMLLARKILNVPTTHSGIVHETIYAAADSLDIYTHKQFGFSLNGRFRYYHEFDGFGFCFSFFLCVWFLFAALLD